MNPKSSTKIPKNAGKRRVHACGQSTQSAGQSTQSVGHWYTDSSGKRVSKREKFIETCLYIHIPVSVLITFIFGAINRCKKFSHC